MRRILSILRRMALVVLLLLSPIILYLAANLIGAIIPSPIASVQRMVTTSEAKMPAGNAAESQTSRSFYVLTNFLHADIAIPFDPKFKSRFSFLADTGVMFDHDGIRYMLFGWGSKEFYQSAKNWSDIRLSPMMTAITGDKSLMHVQPVGDIADQENALKMTVSAENYERLMDVLWNSFDHTKLDRGVITGDAYELGDRFYDHKDRFNIFRPCNIWVSRVLNQIGIRTGIWTPTTQALQLGIYLHSRARLV